MRRDEGLAAAVFALTIGVAIAFAVAADITAPLCEAAKIKSVAPDKIEFGCLEFWTNRYQGMIAAFLGAGIALYVVRPAIKQVTEMNRQTAAQLMDRAEAQARELESEREALQAFYRIKIGCDRLLSLFNFDDLEAAYRDWHKDFYEELERIRSFLFVVVAAEQRSDPNSVESASRTTLAERMHLLELAARDLNQAFISMTIGADPSEGEEDWSPTQIKAAEKAFQLTVESMIDAHTLFARRHAEALQLAWARKHRFTEKAFA